MEKKEFIEITLLECELIDFVLANSEDNIIDIEDTNIPINSIIVMFDEGCNSLYVDFDDGDVVNLVDYCYDENDSTLIKEIHRKLIK